MTLGDGMLGSFFSQLCLSNRQLLLELFIATLQRIDLRLLFAHTDFEDIDTSQQLMLSLFHT